LIRGWFCGALTAALGNPLFQIRQDFFEERVLDQPDNCLPRARLRRFHVSGKRTFVATSDRGRFCSSPEIPDQPLIEFSKRAFLGV